MAFIFSALMWGAFKSMNDNNPQTRKIKQRRYRLSTTFWR